MNSEPEDSFLTVAEVAGMLKLNQQTVRNWIDQGSLPALRVGRRVRIKRSDFDRVVARAYTGGSGSVSSDAGPTAEDFWGGEAVGVAEPGFHAGGSAGGKRLGGGDAGSQARATGRGLRGQAALAVRGGRE
jgi:excisionase family DNA binding protein